LNSILRQKKLVRIQINTETNWIKTLFKNSVLVAHFVLGFLNPALTGKCKTFVCKKRRFFREFDGEPLQERFLAFTVHFLKQNIT
jgi:hypothetical protein